MAQRRCVEGEEVRAAVREAEDELHTSPQPVQNLDELVQRLNLAVPEPPVLVPEYVAVVRTYLLSTEPSSFGDLDGRESVRLRSDAVEGLRVDEPRRGVEDGHSLGGVEVAEDADVVDEFVEVGGEDGGVRVEMDEADVLVHMVRAEVDDADCRHRELEGLAEKGYEGEGAQGDGLGAGGELLHGCDRCSG